MANTAKYKYWTGVLYPENMVDNWEDEISTLLQLPFCYCIHNKDVTTKEGEDRKEHVHIILAFPNPTTYNHALTVFSRLSAEGKKALNTCQNIINIRFMYEYLIHNTDDCKKKKKHLYLPSERISGNNFDIGSFEQLTLQDKHKMCKEVCDFIIDNQLCNFADFYTLFVQAFEPSYFDLLTGYSGLFDRLINGNYQKYCYVKER